MKAIANLSSKQPNSKLEYIRAFTVNKYGFIAQHVPSLSWQGELESVRRDLFRGEFIASMMNYNFEYQNPSIIYSRSKSVHFIFLVVITQLVTCCVFFVGNGKNILQCKSFLILCFFAGSSQHAETKGYFNSRTIEENSDICLESSLLVELGSEFQCADDLAKSTMESSAKLVAAGTDPNILQMCEVKIMRRTISVMLGVLNEQMRTNPHIICCKCD